MSNGISKEEISSELRKQQERAIKLYRECFQNKFGTAPNDFDIAAPNLKDFELALRLLDGCARGIVEDELPIIATQMGFAHTLDLDNLPLLVKPQTLPLLAKKTVDCARGDGSIQDVPLAALAYFQKKLGDEALLYVAGNSIDTVLATKPNVKIEGPLHQSGKPSPS